MLDDEIRTFAMKWLTLYSDKEINRDLLENGFAEEYFTLGFKMDAGNAFIKVYGQDAFDHTSSLWRPFRSPENCNVIWLRKNI